MNNQISTGRHFLSISSI